MRKTLESYPNLVKEFHFKKNQPLLPKDLTSSSGIRIWWKCKNGHEWESKVYNRTRIIKHKFKTVIGTGCPYCSNKKASKENNLKVLFPTLAKEWHPTKNENLKPEQVTKSSNKKVWWKCKKGHEWKTAITNRSHGGTNCPYCFNIKKKLLLQ